MVCGYFAGRANRCSGFLWSESSVDLCSCSGHRLGSSWGTVI